MPSDFDIRILDFTQYFEKEFYFDRQKKIDGIRPVIH